MSGSAPSTSASGCGDGAGPSSSPRAPGYRLVAVAEAARTAGPGRRQSSASRRSAISAGALAERRGRRRRARLAALDPPATLRARARRGLPRDLGEAPRARPRRRARDRGGRAPHGPARDGGAELPLPAPVPRAPRAGPGRRARAAARRPDLCRRDLRGACISPRDWRGRMPHPYLLDMAIHHVDMLRMITGREVVEVDARSWRAPDSPFRHDPTRRRAAHARRRDAGLVRGHVGGAALARRRGTATGSSSARAGRATWSGGVDDALRGTRAVRPPRRAAAARRPAAAAGGRPARACSPSFAGRSQRATAPETLGRRQRPQPRRRSSRSRARPRSAGPSEVEEVLARVKIGLFLALYSDLPARGGARRRGRAGLRGVEIVSGARARIAGRPSSSADAARARAHRCRGRGARARRSRRSPVTATRSIPTPQVATAADRDFRDTVRLAAELGVCDRGHLLRLPRRVGALAAAELGHVLVAGRLPGDARLAVGRTRAAVLGRGGRVRPLARDPGGDRAAPGLRRLQHRIAPAAARGGGRRRGRELRPFAPLLAGDGSDRVRAALSARRSSTCMRRTRPSTEDLAVNGVLETIPSDRPAERSWIFRSVGEGHPAVVLARARGRAPGGRLRRMRSRSSTRTRCSRGRTVSAWPSRRCARRLPRELSTRPSAPRPTSPARFRRPARRGRPAPARPADRAEASGPRAAAGGRSRPGATTADRGGGPRCRLRG